MADRSKAVTRSPNLDASKPTSTPTVAAPHANLEAALEAAINRIKEVSRDSHHSAAIDAHWELGRVIWQLRSSQSQSDQTDETAITGMGSIRLSRRFQLKSTQIKIAGYIYRAYPTTDARDRMLGMRRADGSPLRISVVSRLCFPRLDRERETLLRRACDENWSETRIKELLGTPSNNNTQSRRISRKPKLPNSLSEALARWQRRADETIRYAENFFQKDVVNRLLEDTAPGAVTIDQVETLRNRVREVRKATAIELKALDRIIDHLEKIRDKVSVPESFLSKPDSVAD